MSRVRWGHSLMLSCGVCFHGALNGMKRAPDAAAQSCPVGMQNIATVEF